MNPRAEQLLQISRYGVLGILTNALLFLGYLVLSDFGIGAKTSFASLMVFVDLLLLPADYVVLALIVVTAGVLFALQRYWVFPYGDRGAARTQQATAP